MRYDIDFIQLKLLNALFNEKNISDVVQELQNEVKMSQPGMSNRLKKLNQVFGDDLFSTTKRGIVITPKAKSLRAELGKELRHVIQIVERYQKNQYAIQFNLGISDYIISAGLNRILDSICHTFGYGIELNCLPSNLNKHPALVKEVRDHIASGKLDLVIHHDESLLDSNHHIDKQKIYAKGDRFVAITAYNYELPISEVTIDNLINHESQIILVDLPQSNILLEQIPRNKCILVSSFECIPSMLFGTTYIAIVPERVANHWVNSHEINTYLFTKRTTALNVYLAWNRALSDNRDLQTFKKLIKHQTSSL